MKNTVVTCFADRPRRHRIAHLRALIGLQPEQSGRRDELSDLLHQELSDASAD